MKKILTAAVATLAATLMLTSCSSGSATKVSPKEFADVISDESVVVLDVRTPAEFASGHLPNAININFEGANFKQEVSALDKSTTYAVYCRSGNRSSQAVKVMADAGLTSLYDLDGGIIDWQAAGGQLVTN
jgi:rhodanese-related sulfurtransferase